MNSEDRFWLGFWTLACIAVIFVAACFTYGRISTTRMFVDGGYHECSLTGLSTAAWCK